MYSFEYLNGFDAFSYPSEEALTFEGGAGGRAMDEYDGWVGSAAAAAGDAATAGWWFWDRLVVEREAFCIHEGPKCMSEEVILEGRTSWAGRSKGRRKRVSLKISSDRLPFQVRDTA
jgi:hypothetical protein